MTRREIAELMCKALSLLIIAYSIYQLAAFMIYLICTFLFSLFHDWADWSELTMSLLFLAPFLTLAIVAAIYWKWSRKIAEFMVSDDPEPVTTVSISVRDVMVVVYSLCGVLLLLNGVKGMVGVLILVEQFSSGPEEMWNMPKTWSAITEIIFGTWLLLGSHGIVRAIYWLRTTGRPEYQDEPEIKNS